jgi:acyl dehydratase
MSSDQISSDQISKAVLSLSEVEVGQELPSRSIHVSRATLVQYAGASLDRNLIHWDERFAKSVGLPDVIAHGMFTMGSAINIVSDWVGDAGRVVEYSTRFTKPVVVPYESGADVEVTGVVKAVDTETRRAAIELKAMCGAEKVLGRALAVVVLD